MRPAPGRLPGAAFGLERDFLLRRGAGGGGERNRQAIVTSYGGAPIYLCSTCTSREATGGDRRPERSEATRGEAPRKYRPF